MKFVKPCMENKDEIAYYLQYNTHKGCEFALANILLWSSFYNTDYVILNDNIVFHSRNGLGEERFAYPIGPGDAHSTINLLLEYAKQMKKQLRLEMMDTAMYTQLCEWYPERVSISYHRDSADYIYLRERLTSLAGKKLHGKRNHIHRFVDDNPTWKYETITDENREDCIFMARKWCALNDCEKDEEKEEEYNIVVQALKHQKILGLIGGALRVDGKIIAFTLGEPVTKDTFVVHFEKAYAEIQGAYPMINQQFVTNELQEFTYINREEDLGVEGLRKAKLSYGPDILLEKGTVVIYQDYV